MKATSPAPASDTLLMWGNPAGASASPVCPGISGFTAGPLPDTGENPRGFSARSENTLCVEPAKAQKVNSPHSHVATACDWQPRCYLSPVWLFPHLADGCWTTHLW